MAKVFLSSARSNHVLADMRDELRNWADINGIDLWQFERHPKPYWDGIGFPRSAAACLTEVDRCELYLAVFHGAYGGSGSLHAAAVALTDLEFFEAVREGKQIRFYVVEPHAPGSELKALLSLVRTAVPNSYGGSGTAGQVVTAIKDDIARHLARPELRAPWRARAFRTYGRAITRLRSRELLGVDGLQVLPRGSRSSFAHAPADDLKDAMKAIGAIADPRLRESELSAFLPDLAAVPYFESVFDGYRAVWDDYCDLWLRTTAWRGHHNALRMGRLAMLNSQMVVRCLMASSHDRLSLAHSPLPTSGTIGDAAAWIRVFALGGALASEYYSLAKEQHLQRQRRQFLRRGLEFLTVAGRARELLNSAERTRLLAGLAAIRGHIYVELEDPTLDPVDAFEESMRHRLDLGATGSWLGEAKADLGYALVRQGLWRSGHDLLVQGVHDLEATIAKGFAARAKLKLANCYLRRGWIPDAMRQLSEADAICDLHGIQRRRASGVLSQVALEVLRAVARRTHNVRARQSSCGYQYETV